jgi:hypothetical protein
VDYLEVEEAQAILKTVLHKDGGYSKFKRYRNRAIIALMFSASLRIMENYAKYGTIAN